MNFDVTFLKIRRTSTLTDSDGEASGRRRLRSQEKLGGDEVLPRIEREKNMNPKFILGKEEELYFSERGKRKKTLKMHQNCHQNHGNLFTEYTM
jgi:hypothetical protein